MKIGLFFGSFNPIHVGHLVIGQAALNETDLDRVWFVVSPQNPFKTKASLLGEYDRLRMVELAIGDNPDIEASNIEFTLPKPSYTADTLRHLSKLHPGYEFALIMGEDNLESLHKWKDYEYILEKYKIYCHPRIGSDSSRMAQYPQIEVFKLNYLDVSATRIRDMIKAKKSVRYLVPEDVHDYIEKENLYAAD
jgi:nicotinate-nucleotide adenylyltransferase